MRFLDPELQINLSAGPTDRARLDIPGDQRGDEHVAPVPRRRYITY